MGASEKTMSLDGKLTEEQVKQRFYDRQQYDREEYGEDPYNGSFTTFDGIKFASKQFTNWQEARDYILDNTKKWGNALAVKVNEDEHDYWLVGGWAAE